MKAKLVQLFNTFALTCLLSFIFPVSAQQVSSQSEWIDILSDQGETFIGHQLESFSVSDDGIITTDKPQWLNIYRTENRAFGIRGEVKLGGPYIEMFFAEDLPDGFALFVREWDGVRRYQLDSRQATVKRRLHLGSQVPGVKVLNHLLEPELGEWIPFVMLCSEEGIHYRLGQNRRNILGRLDTDGANKIAIAPGTALRNIQITTDMPVDSFPRLNEEDASGDIDTSRTNSSDNLVRNGEFQLFSNSNERGVFGEPMFEPGAKQLKHWVVKKGLVGLRKNSQENYVLELGPRNQPGAIQQMLTTEPGATYFISLLACSGRSQFHMNRKIRIAAGDLDETIKVAVGSQLEAYRLQFTASTSSTLLEIEGVEKQGFGPIIDNLKVTRQ